MPFHTRSIAFAGLAAAALSACPALAQETADCPDSVPAGTECFRGQDENGAWYLIAKPQDWNGVLVLHAHGGPRLSPPAREDADEDLARFAMMVEEGYAWAGSNYRREGFGVRMAAEDMLNLVPIAVEAVGEPEVTILHGQSWGGNVAAKAAELHAIGGDGARRFDGVLLTNGLLAGGPRPYDFRADLRAVYQFYCRNHPRADEEQYPLWRGRAEGSEPIARADIEARVEECTGLSKAPEERSEEEARNLADILAVTRVPERTLVAHLNFATNTFADIVGERLDGLNPFTNEGVHYEGSHDDEALNEGVERFRTDPDGLRRLTYDSGLTGQIVLPTLTVHAIDDPTAFVELEDEYRRTVAAAGNADLLVQTFVREGEHSRLSAPQYPALLEALVDWIEDGRRPTAARVAELCADLEPRYGDETCHFETGYAPPPLATRSPER